MEKSLEKDKPLLHILCPNCHIPIHYMLLDSLNEHLATKLYIKHLNH